MSFGFIGTPFLLRKYKPNLINNMSYFNQKTPTTRTENLAGGNAYAESNELHLASILLTSFGDDKFYQKSTKTMAQLSELIKKSDKQFAAQAICYARNVFGMRTITHFAASELAQYIGGQSWAKDFYYKVVKRPDDITEILACHFAHKRIVTNAMKKGFAKALENFDKYQISKYRGDKNQVKLLDAVNICHPKESKKNNGAIGQLMTGALRTQDTWESLLSAAGGDTDKKIHVWQSLLDSNKLGYFALLRNIRNIIELSDDYVTATALKALVNADSIHNSLVLPFRFMAAYEQLKSVDSNALSAIAQATEIACDNVPTFEGKTLVALDVSGSMESARVSSTASLFAAVLLKKGNTDLITFSDDAQYKHVNRMDSVISIAESIRYSCGGTNLGEVFCAANKAYDRVIILSDMQSWIENGYLFTFSAYRKPTPSMEFARYKNRYACPNTKIYSVDLAGYGTLTFPERNVYCLAGFSEKLFDIMKLLENDKNALINTIKDYKLNE